MLDGIPDQERALLESDAADDAFRSVDLARRRGHLKLQRLNEREQAILEVLSAARYAEMSSQWSQFVDRYSQAAEDLAAAGRALAEHHTTLTAIVNEAAAAGFSPYRGQAHLPFIELKHNQSALETLLSVIPGLRIKRFGPRGDEVYGLRFTEWAEVRGTGYQAGQVAGFKAADAWLLVRAQRAEWIDPTRIPPASPPKVRSTRRPAPKIDVSGARE